MDLEPRLREKFSELIRSEGLDELSEPILLDDYFDEVPLYSRYAQLDFLRGMSTDRKNRVLVAAAVWHLESIVSRLQGRAENEPLDYMCMVSIADWEYFDADGDLITPQFWCANPSRGVFEHLRIYAPTSRYSEFVSSVIGGSESLEVGENYGRANTVGHVERVYVISKSLSVPGLSVRRKDTQG
jgi:hypothetical protein